MSVVSIEGEIDLETCEQAEAVIASARGGADTVVLDLRGVEFMDTSGLRLVIEERRRASTCGYRFAVVRGPRPVQRLFEIAGFSVADGMFVDAPDELIPG